MGLQRHWGATVKLVSKLLGLTITWVGRDQSTVKEKAVGTGLEKGDWAPEDRGCVTVAAVNPARNSLFQDRACCSESSGEDSGCVHSGEA